MDRSELLRLYPKVFHMAEPQAWPMIERHGLRSTQALLDLFEIPTATQQVLTRAHRPKGVPIAHPEHGSAVVRDQIPLHPRKLAACLQDGTTVAEFLELLNNRVFFWLQEVRLERLLRARAYRDREHLVITVDTARLLDHVGDDRVTLSRINTGSTVFKAAPRSRHTFKSIQDYPHPVRTRPSTSGADIAELCVLGHVPGVTQVADHVEVRGPSGRRTVWERESGRTA